MSASAATAERRSSTSEVDAAEVDVPDVDVPDAHDDGDVVIKFVI